MQVQIFKRDTKELVAWLYIDCAEEKLVDTILLNGYEIKYGKSLQVKEILDVPKYNIKKEGENA